MDASPDLPPRSRVPVFNLPGVVTASIAVLVGIHAVRQVLPDVWDVQTLIDLSFIPARWTMAFDPAKAQAIIQAAGEGISDPVTAAARQDFARALISESSPMPWTLASYGLLHGSWMHVIFNVVWLAAFGSPVARRYGPWRYGVLALAGIVAGALLHLIIDPLNAMPLVGASAGIAALMAAAARFVFRPPSAYRPAMAWQIAPPPRLETIPELMRNRSAVLFLVIWLGTNLLFGLISLPLGAGDGPIAWDAHLGGFLVGFFLLPLLEPRRRPEEG
ncbi:rhomboid family intramembrane serine protease [Methylobacterium sp. C25]|uniref:rhomboid family intramembrane serine protease n=1 Tax=Methylobacterium sp. C25 TaxID=2721622 RepID=UPI001F3CA5E3|nr:rhomboid family intramembrane serine protease [Methylobacterium sp. C25]MCE4224806.1 rhomboid family intramembrane serine protease [Methylobacterium sp. C25]